jgi:hypothetical protein
VPTSNQLGYEPATQTSALAAPNASVQRWARQAASGRSRLPLPVLELVGALAAHPVEFIARAGVLKPRMTTVGAVAELPQLLSSLSPSPSSLEDTAHGASMPHHGSTLMPHGANTRHQIVCVRNVRKDEAMNDSALQAAPVEEVLAGLRIPPLPAGT